jgi:hypothetical protein
MPSINEAAGKHVEDGNGNASDAEGEIPDTSGSDENLHERGERQ